MVSSVKTFLAPFIGAIIAGAAIIGGVLVGLSQQQAASLEAPDSHGFYLGYRVFWCPGVSGCCLIFGPIADNLGFIAG
jgi:hypothetical protein